MLRAWLGRGLVSGAGSGWDGGMATRNHLVVAACFAAAAVCGGEPEPEPGTVPAREAEGPTAEQVAELHALAEEWWERFMPETVKEEFELIGREELHAWLARVTQTGKAESLEDYAAGEEAARAAITAMEVLPELEDLRAWLQVRLGDLEVAREAVARAHGVPLYDLWLARVAKRPVPAAAAGLLPVLRKAFAAEGVPEALVWLAEAESGFNPKARNPSGARGLFQLMPGTARGLGLSLFPFDNRSHPERSARAAAAHLRGLHARFGDWPLALAAYNAGEGRVLRAMKAGRSREFAIIARHLPAETRLYVPKVLAMVEVRAGVTPEELAAKSAVTK